MIRGSILGALGGLLILAATPVFGQGALGSVVGQLEAQGYEIVEVRRTLLGRIRVQAISGRHSREVVFDRGTGEVLRDLVQPLVAQRSEGEDDRSGDAHGNSNDDDGGRSGRGGSDDDDDDDRSGSGGGDDDDDRSGPGGGDDDDDRSGSGGGGSDDDDDDRSGSGGSDDNDDDDDD